MNYPTRDIAWLRATGILGMVGAIFMFAGDMALAGSFLSGAEFLKQVTILIGSGSNLRLMIGGLMGPFAAIFYIIGAWQFYLACTPGNPRLRFVMWAMFAAGMIMGASYQSGHVFCGYLFKMQHAVAPRVDESLAVVITQSIAYLELQFLIAGIFAGIGSLIFIYAIVFTPTRYPKWMAIFSPAAILALSPLARYAPAPLGGILMPGAINIGFFSLFFLSTWVLWNGGISRTTLGKRSS